MSRVRSTRSRPVLVACAVLAATPACGSAAISRHVPVTLASAVVPVAEVSPESDYATIIMVNPGFSKPVHQAITVISEAGQYLGQIGPHSWIQARVKPGPLGIFAGVTETEYPQWCRGIRGATIAGRTYVFLVSTLFGTANVAAVDPRSRSMKAVAQRLSRFAQLEPRKAAGQQRVDAAMRDYWKPCLDEKDAHDREMAKTMLAETEEFRRASRFEASYGFGTITLPDLP